MQINWRIIILFIKFYFWKIKSNKNLFSFQLFYFWKLLFLFEKETKMVLRTVLSKGSFYFLFLQYFFIFWFCYFFLEKRNKKRFPPQSNDPLPYFDSKCWKFVPNFQLKLVLRFPPLIGSAYPHLAPIPYGDGSSVRR